MQDPRNEGAGQALDLRRNFTADGARVASYGRLVERVFGSTLAETQTSDPCWDVLAYFEADGTCVAGIEVGEFALMLDGGNGTATAIRLAGVAPSHRGQGLFRGLMDAALRAFEARRTAVPTLLYTEDDDLYARFGFVSLAQHAFVGVAPEAACVSPARMVDRAQALVVIDRLEPVRAPISLHCAVLGAADLLRSNLGDDDLRFAMLHEPEALLIFEMDGNELVVVDIVAATIPTMAEIVGALGSDVRRVRTLFPPDRLRWDATPRRDDAGLMIRGRVPPAMIRPFMLPPTMSF